MRILRFEDLLPSRRAAPGVHSQYETYFFWLEMCLALIAPLVLLSIKKVRKSPGGLYLCAVLVVLGFITNRLNVSITGTGTLGRPSLYAQLDGVLGDGSHGRRRLRLVRAGSEVPAHLRG